MRIPADAAFKTPCTIRAVGEDSSYVFAISIPTTIPNGVVIAKKVDIIVTDKHLNLPYNNKIMEVKTCATTMHNATLQNIQEDIVI